MTVHLLTTGDTGWSRATRPRKGRLWLWARNPPMCVVGEPGQAVDVRVGGGEDLGEDDQAVGAQADGVGPQRGGHGGQVAQRGRADAGRLIACTAGDGRLAGGPSAAVLVDP